MVILGGLSGFLIFDSRLENQRREAPKGALMAPTVASDAASGVP